MEREGRLALTVGTFVLVALAALAVSILSLTTERGLFAREYRLRAPFENVLGLQAGAPVWLAGKDVGRVESIRFTTFQPGRDQREGGLTCRATGDFEHALVALANPAAAI